MWDRQIGKISGERMRIKNNIVESKKKIERKRHKMRERECESEGIEPAVKCEEVSQIHPLLEPFCLASQPPLCNY